MSDILTDLSTSPENDAITAAAAAMRHSIERIDPVKVEPRYKPLEYRWLKRYLSQPHHAVKRWQPINSFRTLETDRHEDGVNGVDYLVCRIVCNLFSHDYGLQQRRLFFKTGDSRLGSGSDDQRRIKTFVGPGLKISM